MMAGIAVLLALIFFPQIGQRYQQWHYQRSLAQTATVAKSSDTAMASPQLALSASLRSNPGNPVAWQMAADFLENTGDRGALSLRQQIIETTPTNPQSRLALARSHLRFQEIAEAELVLDSIPETAQRTPDFIITRAALLLAQGDALSADALLAEAIPVSNNTETIKLERQLLRLRYGNFSQATDARAYIEAASLDSSVRARLLRELIGSDLRRNELPIALNRGNQLVSLPDATYSDRLLLADLTLQQSPTRLPEQQRALATEATQNADNAVRYVGWLTNYQQTDSAITWLDAQPEAIRNVSELRAARAGLAFVQENLEQASRLLDAGAWGQIDPQAVQLAMSARLLQSRERPELRREVWTAALAASAKKLSGLQILRQLALFWKWDAEYETTLFSIARSFPRETWAHQLLAENFLRKKQSAELKSVYDLWHQADPANVQVEADGLLIALLLQPAMSTNTLTDRAAKLYESAPTSASVATAYALSLWQLGRIDDALSTLDKLPAHERRSPERAHYYALYLAAARRPEEARTYLELVKENNLLSEERSLLTRARSLAGARAR